MWPKGPGNVWCWFSALSTKLSKNSEKGLTSLAETPTMNISKTSIVNILLVSILLILILANKNQPIGV